MSEESSEDAKPAPPLAGDAGSNPTAVASLTDMVLGVVNAQLDDFDGRWAEQRNQKPGSGYALSDALVDRGFNRKRGGGGVRGFRNLVVNPA